MGAAMAAEMAAEVMVGESVEKAKVEEARAVGVGVMVALARAEAEQVVAGERVVGVAEGEAATEEADLEAKVRGAADLEAEVMAAVEREEEEEAAVAEEAMEEAMEG